MNLERDLYGALYVFSFKTFYMTLIRLRTNNVTTNNHPIKLKEKKLWLKLWGVNKTWTLILQRKWNVQWLNSEITVSVEFYNFKKKYSCKNCITCQSHVSRRFQCLRRCIHVYLISVAWEFERNISYIYEVEWYIFVYPYINGRG